MDLYDNDYINIDGNYIHKTAVVAENVELGKGNIIMPYAVIGEPGFIRGSETKGKIILGDHNKIGCHCSIMAGEGGETKIGSNNLIMSHVNIGHNTTIHNNCEIGAGTIIAGWVVVENGVHIKIGARVRNRKVIGANAVIGMGSNVVADVTKGKTVYGNPARELL